MCWYIYLSKIREHNIIDDRQVMWHFQSYICMAEICQSWLSNPWSPSGASFEPLLYIFCSHSLMIYQYTCRLCVRQHGMAILNHFQKYQWQHRCIMIISNMSLGEICMGGGGIWTPWTKIIMTKSDMITKCFKRQDRYGSN